MRRDKSGPEESLPALPPDIPSDEATAPGDLATSSDAVEGRSMAFDGAAGDLEIVSRSLLTSRDDGGVRRGPYEAAYQIEDGYTIDPAGGAPGG